MKSTSLIYLIRSSNTSLKFKLKLQIVILFTVGWLNTLINTSQACHENSKFLTYLICDCSTLREILSSNITS